MLYVSIMLMIAATITDGWSTLNLSDTALIAVSGLIGIFVGDVALFTAMARKGPVSYTHLTLPTILLV